jgi:uncharacterized protein YutE (UPF0331/DUF86 family)
MDNQLLEAKLSQLLHILRETAEWLGVPGETFCRETKLVRACQRNLQLLVEYASDINGILILEFGKKAPGSYRESFSSVFDMDFASTLSATDRDELLASVDWRNDLIHEYEPEQSSETFYRVLKEFLVAYRNYAQLIHGRFLSPNSIFLTDRP